jgi:DNA mismatch repair ATPase MutS
MMAFMVDLEAMYAFAKYYRTYRAQLKFPRILEPNQRRFMIREGHHPYLIFNPESESAANSVEFMALGGIDGDTTKILTGPNTGGKTTFLRMIGNLGIMAQVGLPIPVEDAELSPMTYWANFAAVNDTVANGQSTFFGQARRTGEIASTLEANPEQPAMVLMDEILVGTSAGEHQAAEQAVLEALHQNPMTLSVLATHDRSISGLAEKLPSVGNLQVSLNGHRIVAGPSEVFNAFQVMQEAGVPDAIVLRALEIFKANHPAIQCEPLLLKNRSTDSRTTLAN